MHMAEHKIRMSSSASRQGMHHLHMPAERIEGGGQDSHRKIDRDLSTCLGAGQ